VIKRSKFKKIRTEAEHVCEFAYRPGKCRKDYRRIVLRKTLKVVKGEGEVQAILTEHSNDASRGW
jgi:hypothetical protein